MTGSFKIADLNITIEGSLKELAEAQGVEREFHRACRRLRTQSESKEVFFRVDDGLEGENGTFHKFRLRAYSPNAPEVYTIDCGITDKNPIGIYVGWDAPIRVYNRETEQVRTIEPQTGERFDSSRTPPAARQQQPRQSSAPDDPLDALAAADGMPSKRLHHIKSELKYASGQDVADMVATLKTWEPEQPLTEKERRALDSLIEQHEGPSDSFEPDDDLPF